LPTLHNPCLQKVRCNKTINLIPSKHGYKSINDGGACYFSRYLLYTTWSLDKVGFESWNSYLVFKHKVKYGYRYIQDSETSKFLSEILSTLSCRKKRIDMGKIFWRAQIGHDWEPIFCEGEKIDKDPCPYGLRRMKPMEGSA
jgi:hypothetical protein